MSEPGGAADLERVIGHRFADPALLENALIHASLAAETDGSRGNERLEFLGDAVIDLVAAELLYVLHPDWSEGELTRARATLVNKTSLARCARRLDLGRHLRLGRTEERSGGAEKDTLLADAFEAVLGALYLDAGLTPVAALARELFGQDLTRAAERDPKTEFQEWAHAELGETPRYQTAADSGVDDDEHRFTVEVRVSDRVFGEGVGRSKRLAEQEAARIALVTISRDG